MRRTSTSPTRTAAREAADRTAAKPTATGPTARGAEQRASGNGYDSKDNGVRVGDEAQAEFADQHFDISGLVTDRNLFSCKNRK